MTVERGRDWGEPGTVPAGAVVAGSDAEAAAIVTDARRAKRPLPPLHLKGGDLARTLGAGGSSRSRSGQGVRLRVDLGCALLDGRLHWFVAHLVARRSWWWGRVVVIANAAHLGDWNIAPRSHPGDGRLDLLDADLSLSDRWKAWRRLPSGTHLPHPAITARRVDAVQLDLGRPLPIRLDGASAGMARNLSVRVEPDALEIWI